MDNRYGHWHHGHQHGPHHAINKQSSLSKYISLQIFAGKKITLIDCTNSINQYLFAREEIESIMDNLYVARIEQIHDLIECLSRIHLDKFFRKSDLLIITSYEHLLKDQKDKIYLRQKIIRIVERIKKTKTVVHHAKESEMEVRHGSHDTV